MRVLGVDPGTLSFDLCGLADGEVFLARTVRTATVQRTPDVLIRWIFDTGPYDLIVAPSGYGAPLLRAHRVGEREIAQMVLVRADEAGHAVGIGGMRTLIRRFRELPMPVVFVPGVIHLATVPVHRKVNRVDMGTADKVCSAALAIADQARELNIPYDQTSCILVEIGGAFSAVLAIERGQIVDGMGGTSGPLGARGCGAMDGEVAYLLGPSLSKDTLFSGGVLDIAGIQQLPDDPVRRHTDRRWQTAWRAWTESIEKAVRAMLTVVPQPREVLVTGRPSVLALLFPTLQDRLQDIAPVRIVRGLHQRHHPVPIQAAAQGAAIIADGLAGGRYADLVATMALHRAQGSVLDYLFLRGSTEIRLG